MAKPDLKVPHSDPIPPAQRLPDFLGLQLLPKPPKPTEGGEKLYKELWQKVSWAIGSSYNCPYQGSSQVRSLARRLVLVIEANEDQIIPKK